MPAMASQPAVVVNDDGEWGCNDILMICVAPHGTRSCTGAMGHDQAPNQPPSHRLLRDWSQDRCLARLGPGVRRGALTMRLPTGVIGVALSCAFSSGTVAS